MRRLALIFWLWAGSIEAHAENLVLIGQERQFAEWLLRAEAGESGDFRHCIAGHGFADGTALAVLAFEDSKVSFFALNQDWKLATDGEFDGQLQFDGKTPESVKFNLLGTYFLTAKLFDGERIWAELATAQSLALSTEGVDSRFWIGDLDTKSIVSILRDCVASKGQIMLTPLQ